MMKLLIVGGFLALVMAGCNLIPPITVSDPLALNGKSFDLITSSPAVSSQATQSGSVIASFSDIDLSNIPLSPSSLNICYDFSISTNVAFTGSITLSNIKLDVSVNDGTNGPASVIATADNLVLTSNGTVATASGKNLCGKVSDIAKMIAVIKNAPQPNTVRGTFTLDTSIPLPSGTTLRVAFSNGKGQFNL